MPPSARVLLTVLVPLAGLAAGPAAAGTWSVDDSGGADFTRIQDAIAAASSGDSIDVAAGTYAEVIDFLGKDVDVRASEGPGATYIIGDGAGPVVSFRTAEGPGAMLSGFDVSGGNTAGDSNHGAGIDVYLASPTLKDLVVHGNLGYVGGGMLLYQSDSLVEDCVFRDNQAPDGAGGGIYSYLGSPVFRDLSLEGNLARQGGGLYVWGGAPEIHGGDVRGNTADHGGGIRWDVYAGGVVSGVILEQNQAVLGGGLYVGEGTAVRVEDCWVNGNTATEDGGGIRWTGKDAAGVLYNALVRDNSAVGNGGGMLVDGGAVPEIFSTEFVSNAALYGGGTFFQDSTVSSLRSVWYDNRAVSGGGGYVLSSAVTFEGARFANNAGDLGGGNGGGLALEEATGGVRASLFLDNEAYSGGGLHVRDSVSIDVHNNTFAGNSGPNSAAGIRVSSAIPDLRGNIVAFNAQGSGISTAPGSGTLAYNNVFSNPEGNYSGGVIDPTGTDGNVAVDPDFVDFSSDGDGLADNLRLGPSSASRDAGDPSALYNDPDGSRNDQGAYGGPGAGVWDLPDPLPPEPGLGDDDDTASDDDASGDDDASDDDASDDDIDPPGDDDASGDDDDDDGAGDDDGPGRGCNCDASPPRPGGWSAGAPALALAFGATRRRVYSRRS